MAFFEIPSNPSYTEEIEQFTAETRAEYGVFNNVFQKILNRIAYVKNSITADTAGAISKTRLLKATLSASGWSSKVPYTQTITVEGVGADDAPIVGCGYPSSLTSDDFDAVEKSYGMINRFTVDANNKLTFYCYKKRPVVDVPIFVKI